MNNQIQIPIPDLQKSAQMREAAKMQKLSNLCSYAANLYSQNFERCLDGVLPADELAKFCIDGAKIMFAELDKLVEGMK